MGREARTLRSDVAGCIPLREQETRSAGHACYRENLPLDSTALTRYIEPVFATSSSRIAACILNLLHRNQAAGPFDSNVLVYMLTAASVPSDRQYSRISLSVINRTSRSVYE